MPGGRRPSARAAPRRSVGPVSGDRPSLPDASRAADRRARAIGGHCSDPPPDPGTPTMDLMTLLRRQKLVVVPLLVLVIAGLAWAYRSGPPVFQATVGEAQRIDTELLHEHIDHRDAADDDVGARRVEAWDLAPLL